MGGFKDKDLMQDTGGKTKAQKNYGGQHKRPPRFKQRKKQRNRFLTKEEKTDMNIQSFENQEKNISNAEQLDLQIGQDGQIYVNDQPTANQVMSFSDLVNIPAEVKDIRNYDDFNTSLNNSMNDDSRYDVQLNEYADTKNIEMDSFDFKDDDSPQIVQQADVSNNDLILSQQEEQSNPFDDLFSDQEEQSEEDTQTEEVDNTEQQNQQEETNVEQEESQDSNDAIDQYLNMQIDDSKLSQQNKKKLDSFTEQQLDAFKKFLYQKKNQE